MWHNGKPYSRAKTQHDNLGGLGCRGGGVQNVPICGVLEANILVRECRGKAWRALSAELTFSQVVEITMCLASVTPDPHETGESVETPSN